VLLRVGDGGVRQWRVQQRSVLHQRVHARADVVRQRATRELHRRRGRLLQLRRSRPLRHEPDLRRQCGFGRVHVRLIALHDRGNNLRQFDHRRHMRKRRAKLRLPVRDVDLHLADVLFGDFAERRVFANLHE
jgi:hypothetical protein